jgi:ABC-type glycerol-3-phosphate transport system permease component
MTVQSPTDPGARISAGSPDTLGRAAVSRARRKTFGVAAAQLVAVLILLGPIIWMYVAAFRPDLDIRSGRLFPRNVTFENFIALFHYDVVRTAFVNSVIVAAVVSVLTTCAAVTAAYAITRMRFRGKGPTLGLILVAQLVPGLVVLVPLVVVMRRAGLADSLVGLAIAHLTLGLPIAVLLLRNYLADIPKSLEEAAMIDGCSVLGALWRVILPLLKPAIVAVTAFSFILSWGEYLLALSLISTDSQKTLPLAMQSLFQLNTVDLGVVMAFGVLISFPVAILFMIIQRSFVSNLGMGGVKE